MRFLRHASLSFQRRAKVRRVQVVLGHPSQPCPTCGASNGPNRPLPSRDQSNRTAGSNDPRSFIPCAVSKDCHFFLLADPTHGTVQLRWFRVGLARPRVKSPVHAVPRMDPDTCCLRGISQSAWCGATIRDPSLPRGKVPLARERSALTAFFCLLFGVEQAVSHSG